LGTERNGFTQKFSDRGNFLKTRAILNGMGSIAGRIADKLQVSKECARVTKKDTWPLRRA
jgi:hypothetical protein